jgi:hypothetical protein
MPQLQIRLALMVRQECGLTLRSSGPPPVRRLGREADDKHESLAAKAPYRRDPLSSNVRPRMNRRLTKTELQAVVGVLATVIALPVAYYVVYELAGFQRVLATGALLAAAWLFHRFVYLPLATRLTDDGKA